MQPKRTDIRRVLRNLALLGVVFAVARFFALRGRPERLPDLPHGMIRDGRVYWLTDEAGGSVIHVRPVLGGTERRLVWESPQNQIVSVSPDSFALTSSAIFYRVTPRPPKIRVGAAGGGLAVGMGKSPVFVGIFRPSASTLPDRQAGREKRTILKAAGVSFPPERIRRVPLLGGRPQDAVKIAGRAVTMVGAYVFWIAPKPDEAVQIESGNQIHTERIGHGDLMVAPLDGGPARKLTSGLAGDTFLIAGADGVYWTEPHAYPDLRVDLYRFRATDSKPLVIPDYNGYLDYGSSPVAFAGRLYWFGTHRNGGQNRFVGGMAAPDCLMSADADGSNVHALRSPIDLHRQPRSPLAPNGGSFYFVPRSQPRSPLAPHRGSLYFVFADTSRGREEHYLYRALSGPDGKGEVVRRLPDQSYNFEFDGGYLYFVVTEEQRSLLDRLTGDEVHTVVKQAYYRLRLPD